MVRSLIAMKELLVVLTLFFSHLSHANRTCTSDACTVVSKERYKCKICIPEAIPIGIHHVIIEDLDKNATISSLSFCGLRWDTVATLNIASTEYFRINSEIVLKSRCFEKLQV